MLETLKKHDAWIRDHVSLPFCCLVFRWFGVRPLELTKGVIVASVLASAFGNRHAAPIYAVVSALLGLMLFLAVFRLAGDVWARQIPVATAAYTNPVRLLFVTFVWVNAGLLVLDWLTSTIVPYTPGEAGPLEYVAMIFSNLSFLITFHILNKDAEVKGMK